MDPITFEIIRHRLFRVIDEAVITLKNVSGSAITNEGHDLMVALYRPDGSLLMGGVGFLHHLTSASEACKHIIREFEGKINEDDIFLLNDPYTAALHTSDVYLVSPIHYNGKLVSWSACFVHVYDIGALNPGGFSPDSRTIYTEGFSSRGIKLVSRGTMREDVLDTLLNMVRSPEMVTLDIRSMIACNNVAKDRMIELIDKYNIENVEDASATLIQQSEDLFRKRLKEIPNGRWESRDYMDVDGKLFRVNLAMTKEGDTLTYDFSGSSPQAEYGINCTYWATWGGLFAPIYPILCHDITWNEGIIRPVKMIVPEGSVVNCTKPAPVSVATVAAIHVVNLLSLHCLSKMLLASDKHCDEASAVWHGSNTAIFLFGKNQVNQDVIGIMTEVFGGSGGARTFADGIDIGGEIPNPISRMANVETVEATFPVLYLFRRRLCDSAGAGKYRGGSGGEYAVVSHNSPDDGLAFVISGKGTQYPMTEGLSGGYAGTPCRYEIIHLETSIHEKGVAPKSRSDLKGDTVPVSWGEYDLTSGKAFYVRWSGGGGYGDPLQRDVAAVQADVCDGIVSIDAARNIYGVEFGSDGLTVDVQMTGSVRKQLRQGRSSEHGG